MMICIIKVVDDYKNANQKQQIVILRKSYQIRYMKSESNMNRECLFCLEMSRQNKLLFFILLKNLSKELSSLPSTQDKRLAENESNSFKQLLRIVFGRQAADYEAICHHKKYYLYCIHKLKCTENDFHFITHKLAQTLAQQNYHLYLLTQQVKNSAESIAEGRVELEKYSDQPSFYQSKGERKRNKGKKRSQRLSQIEIKEELQGNDGANEVLVEEVGMVNSMSYMPLYNSQFKIEPCPTSITLSNINNLGYYYPYPVFYSQNSQ